MDKLLDKRLFKQAAEQALKQLNEYDDQYSGKDLALYYRALQNLNALNDSTNLDTKMCIRDSLYPPANPPESSSSEPSPGTGLPHSQT